MEVGKRISQLRIQQQYSVNKLASLAGISQSYLRDIELGNKKPTVEILTYICDALHISLKDFFDDDSKNTINNQLITKIEQMDSSQREALLFFLDSML